MTEQPTSATTPGTSVSAAATVAVGSCAGTSGSPTLRGASLTRVGAGRPRLRFRLVAGRAGALRLSSLAVSLPRGLRFVVAKGVRLAGGRIRSARLVRGKLVVALVAPVSGVSVTIGNGAIRASEPLARRARTHRVKSLTLVVVVSDSGGHRTRLTHIFKRVR
jgi:hypothetical protein